MTVTLVGEFVCDPANASAHAVGPIIDMSATRTGDWFAHAGQHMQTSFVLGVDTSECLEEEEHRCTYTNQPGCTFEITREAHVPGDIVEGQLVGTCPLTGGDASGATVFPTVTSASFRAPLETYIGGDGGTCTYPYDSGRPSSP